jgi:hypothetical protein
LFVGFSGKFERLNVMFGCGAIFENKFEKSCPTLKRDLPNRHGRIWSSEQRIEMRSDFS